MVIVCCAGLHIARRRGRKDSKLDVIQVNHIAVAGQDAGRLISDSIFMALHSGKPNPFSIRCQVVDWSISMSDIQQVKLRFYKRLPHHI